MARKAQWSDYENSKKRWYGEFVKKVKRVRPLVRPTVTSRLGDLQRAMNHLTKEYLAQLNTFIFEQCYYSKKDARRRSEAAPLIVRT